MIKLFRFILFGILFSTFSAPVLAESHPSIQGKITEVRGYLMAGLTVRARSNSTGREYETTSDEKGNFSFESMSPVSPTISMYPFSSFHFGAPSRPR